MSLSRSFGIGKNLTLFGRTKALENEIDAFLDKLSESGLLFRRGVKVYLAEGASADFGSLRATANPSVTAGLRWAPDTSPIQNPALM